MKKYEYVTKSKFHNYMIQPKHSAEPTPLKPTMNVKQIIATTQNSKPTMNAKQIIAANQNSKPITIKPITDKDGLHESYNRPSGLYIHGNTLYIAGTKDTQDVFDDLKIPFNQTSKALI